MTEPTAKKKRTARATPAPERGHVRPSSALTARNAVMVGNPHALMPTTLYDAHVLSETLSKARQSVGEQLVNKAPEIMFRIVQGSELGMGPCASIRHIYSVHGKVGIESVMLEALARGSDRCRILRQVEMADENHLASTWLCVRADDPHHAYVARWTVGQVLPWHPSKYEMEEFPNLRALKDNGFTGVNASRRKVHAKGGQIPHARKPNWIGNESLMVRKRAATDVIRNALPDVILGVSATETLRDDHEPDDVIDADFLDSELVPLGDVAEHDLGVADEAPPPTSADVAEVLEKFEMVGSRDEWSVAEDCRAQAWSSASVDEQRALKSAALAAWDRAEAT